MLSGAQTCTGSFGEPVVNLTFSSGTNAGPVAATNYTYTVNSCPADGSYTLASSTSGCFGAWHTLSEDHTPGDNIGNMMLVNASNLPGEFYKQTIPDLCPGTTYEFSAYVVNVLQPRAAGIKPDLTFIIESVSGEVLGSYSTGEILESNAPEWKKYGMTFTTTGGISQVVLKIINNAPGGNGNDLALDDITFRPCGPTIRAKVNGNQDSVSVCEGQGTVSLSAEVSPGYTAPAYQWQLNKNNTAWQDIPGATAISVNVTANSVSASRYQYRLAAAEASNINSINCRVLSNSIPLTVIPKPVANAGPDKITMQGKSVKLEGKASGSNLSFFWTPAAYLDDPARPAPIAVPQDDIIYTLHVTDGCNITVTDEVFVKVYKEIVIPNTFTPNGDGINDLWNIAGLKSYTEASVKIFNRYGEIIFKTIGYEKPWGGQYNGRILPTGMYYYIIDLKNNEQIFSGAVSIIR